MSQLAQVSRLPAKEEHQSLDSVLRFKPDEALEPCILEQKVDALHTLGLLLAHFPVAPGRFVPVGVRTRDIRPLRQRQSAPLLVRDIAVERCVHGVHDILKRQVWQRGTLSAVG